LQDKFKVDKSRNRKPKKKKKKKKTRPRTKRFAVEDSDKYWTNATIPFIMSKGFSGKII